MSNNVYRNSEGYYDPTAGAIIAKCDRKEHSDRRKVARKANKQVRKQATAENRSLVYICSPYAGHTVRNILAAQKYCRYAVDEGYLPFAAHLFFPQFLNDENPAERILGTSFGNVFMDKCREIWIFGSEYSTGMKAEYDRAIKNGYRIRYFTTDCREITDHENGGGNGHL
jgi:hypothetical protein